MVYTPVALGLTVLLVTTASAPAQLSLAVAPGSANAVWHSLVRGLAPSSVTTGGVVSTTVTVKGQLIVPHWLLAVAVRALVPTWKKLPGFCEYVIVAAGSADVAAKLTFVPHKIGSLLTLMAPGQ